MFSGLWAVLVRGAGIQCFVTVKVGGIAALSLDSGLVSFVRGTTNRRRPAREIRTLHCSPKSGPWQWRSVCTLRGAAHVTAPFNSPIPPPRHFDGPALSIGGHAAAATAYIYASPTSAGIVGRG